MRKATRAELEELSDIITEHYKSQARKLHKRGEWKWKLPRVTNDVTGKCIPREWYHQEEQIHIAKEQKALLQALVGSKFGDYLRHGGKRKGAGRKRGRTVSSNTITMSDKAWERLDELRGELSRGRFLESRIQNMRKR